MLVSSVRISPITQNRAKDLYQKKDFSESKPAVVPSFKSRFQKDVFMCSQNLLEEFEKTLAKFKRTAKLAKMTEEDINIASKNAVRRLSKEYNQEEHAALKASGRSADSSSSKFESDSSSSTHESSGDYDSTSDSSSWSSFFGNERMADDFLNMS